LIEETILREIWGGKEKEKEEEEKKKKKKQRSGEGEEIYIQFAALATS
jgi:hypothetical protein